MVLWGTNPTFKAFEALLERDKELLEYCKLEPPPERSANLKNEAVCRAF